MCCTKRDAPPLLNPFPYKRSIAQMIKRIMAERRNGLNTIGFRQGLSQIYPATPEATFFVEIVEVVVSDIFF